MRGGKGYAVDAVEKGGDANVAEKQKLTEKQRMFCRLCAAGVKPLEAAKKAGYRNVYGSTGDLLRNERIQQEIKRL
ncbi:MAG: terminase small subunit, partial [Anaerotignum sp.]|nr:terminase small subunit [Anaerotignum sp.]